MRSGAVAVWGAAMAHASVPQSVCGSLAPRHNGPMEPTQDQPALHPAPTASRPAALLSVGAYLALLALLVWGMVYGLRIRCEGFGCMGVVLYWFVWAGLCAVTGLLGLWARSRSLRAGVAVGLVRTAVWGQLLMALGLLAWWWLG